MMLVVKVCIKRRNFNDTFLLQLNAYLEILYRKIMINNIIQTPKVIGLINMLTLRLNCRRKLYNFLHRKIVNNFMRIYETNEKNKEHSLHFLRYEKQEHFECQIVEIRECQMSRGIIHDLDKPQTPKDIVHAKITQAATDVNYNHSIVHNYYKPCVKSVPPVGKNLKKLGRPLIDSKRQEYLYVLFVIFLLVLIPFVDNMYHFIFKPVNVKLSWFQKILRKIYKILNIFFPTH